MKNLPALGIDISKLKFNVCLLKSDEKPKHKVFTNNQQGFKQLSDWLAKQNAEDVHVCLEATGSYGARISLVFTHGRLEGERC